MLALHWPQIPQGEKPLYVNPALCISSPLAVSCSGKLMEPEEGVGQNCR